MEPRKNLKHGIVRKPHLLTFNHSHHLGFRLAGTTDKVCLTVWEPIKDPVCWLYPPMGSRSHHTAGEVHQGKLRVG